MIKHFLGILLAILCTTKSNGQENRTPEDSSVFEKTDAYLKSMVDSLEIVGLNYMVLIDNEIVHQKAMGLAQAQLQTPMTLENSFPVASISKMFSSTALHGLLAQHNRNVNETVADFLPDRTDLPDSWRKLTLKQLLSHTSGIPDQIDYGIYLAPESEKAVIVAMKDKPFSSEPGTESKYNATGFLLVRIIIEKLAGQDFESYMHEQVFDKLNLRSAQYGGFKKVIPGRVTCYQNVNGALEMFPLNYSPPMYAGAGLNITINDLAQWFQAVQKGELLTQAQLNEIWEPVQLNNGNDAYFGLGWEAYRLQGNFKMVGHGGAGISSFRHYWNTETNKSVTVILLTNGAHNWEVRPNQINLQIASMLLTE
ncbi:serine hydrolase domain-containing protein [Flagellimonas allohymeniacidonis]|uniref:Class A beta-lactamase-related serine hydrolase n=1 Tax=Flagellimonas allohymeniacidonis TaxID=2517819 RepID=A0A4Q8QEK1_9FLAO|nr:serine hydrolase domain-containing protein [Allomuricauda hymeniacidonis]TAI48881.1 class A beta-lactamase-related serine hydrolase [Allomuricauda hymeniacidonis]